MECTQRLECTQDLYETRSDRILPEQIGFLGICGVKHPVKHGLNKIGRDPQTCSIVINLNSISRQHAVINVLNQSEFMLMDLDSANKTKLMDKTLPPYIPHPLKNGDMVQLGDIFGVFRLLEEDNELPMTQAIDIPETPVTLTRHMSKLNKAPITTIPESPDISDREESFIAPSQPKREKCFQNSNSQFIKPSAKVISIQPVGSNKIDNVYWSSSKRSVSLNDSSLDDLTMSNKTGGKENDASIFELETQPPPTEVNDSVDSIYTAETQVPPPDIHNQSTQLPASRAHIEALTAPSFIHNLNTQLPPSGADFEGINDAHSIHSLNTQLPPSTSNLEATTISPSIHNLNTQLPPSTADLRKAKSPSSVQRLNTPVKDYLPGVCKIDNQKEVQFDLFTPSKQNNDDISEAETQPFIPENIEIENQTTNTVTKDKNKAQSASNISDEVILFENDSQELIDDFESQPLLPAEVFIHNNTDTVSAIVLKENSLSENKHNAKNDNVTINSDSSTDCEDIDLLPTQKITENKGYDEDLTDCEDALEDMPGKRTNNIIFADMLTQVINENEGEEKDNKNIKKVDLEDMLTQVIVPENDKLNLCKPELDNLEDLPTQVIVSDDDIIITDQQNRRSNTTFEDLPTQVISNNLENLPNHKQTQLKNVFAEELISPFKIPLLSPIKIKRKDIKVITPLSKPVLKKTSPVALSEDDDNYYAATQDILEDLCTQQEILPEDNKTSNRENSDDDFLPSSVEEYELGGRFPHLDNLSPRKKQLMASKSSGSSDGDEHVNNFVSNLSSQQIRSIVGVESKVATLKRVSSDPSASDVELTPKKVRPIKFMEIDLPSSQEIKTSVSVYNKSAVTESSSESEEENDSQECTPILFRKKKKPKVDVKTDLTKLFDAEMLPTRVITRVRKPTAKFQNCDDSKKVSNSILKPKFLTEQEGEIDKEIITENISRLKSKNDKVKNKDSKKDLTSKEIKVKDEAILGGKENATKSEKETRDRTKIKKNNTQKDMNIENRRNDSIKSESKLEVKESTAETGKLLIEYKSKENKSNAKSIKELKPKRKENKVTVDKNNSKIEIIEDDLKSAVKQEINDKKELKRKSDDKNKNKNANKPKSSSIKCVVEDQSAKLTTQANAILRSMRSTKNKRKATANEITSIPIEEDCSQNVNSQSENTVRSSRRRNNNKKVQVEIDLTEDVVEIRRSSRQKPSKEKKEKSVENDKKPAGRRGRPPVKHEQSTVYSVSSESDSPKSVKRRATADLDPPSPKRTRSAGNSNTNSSLNQQQLSFGTTLARVNKTHSVLFTAFPCEEVKAKLEKLGAVVVSDVSACSVVLTLQVKRTFKLLCAVGLGRPIVGPGWVQACADSCTIVDPWLYILKDEAAEKRFQFNLERTLTGKRNFLEGFNVSATPKVMPSAPEMKLIVESSGGLWKEEGANWICISCSADKALWPAVKRRGATIVSTEFILGGVLRQKAEVLANKLL